MTQTDIRQYNALREAGWRSWMLDFGFTVPNERDAKCYDFMQLGNDTLYRKKKVGKKYTS